MPSSDWFVQGVTKEGIYVLCLACHLAISVYPCCVCSQLCDRQSVPHGGRLGGVVHIGDKSLCLPDDLWGASSKSQGKVCRRLLKADLTLRGGRSEGFL